MKLVAIPIKIRFNGATPLSELYAQLAEHMVSAPLYSFFENMDNERLHFCDTIEEKEIIVVRFGASMNEVEAFATLEGTRYKENTLVSANLREALTCAADEKYWTQGTKGRVVVLRAKREPPLSKVDFLSLYKGPGEKRVIKPYAVKIFPASTWFLAKEKES